MVKLIALYQTPENPAEFDEHYKNIHTPLVQKMPGLRKLEVAKITGAPIGEPKHYLIAEMYFDSQDALNASMASPEGKAAARDLMGFAGNIVTMFFAEVQEH
jgi:uncharacterized protein (TIGR02118 family)